LTATATTRNIHILTSARINTLINGDLSKAASKMTIKEKDSIIKYCCIRHGLPITTYNKCHNSDLFAFWLLLDEQCRCKEPFDSEAKMALVIITLCLRGRGIAIDLNKSESKPVGNPTITGLKELVIKTYGE